MKPNGARRRRVVLSAWLLGVMLCAVFVARSTFTADLSAFLPGSPTKEQQVLLDQLEAGVVSRLILIGLEGGESAGRALLSKATASALRKDAAFLVVNNGEPTHAARDQAFLFDHRYLLSPAVRAERFEAAGLQAAISDTLDALASPAGMMIKKLLPRDPTGEMLQLLEQMSQQNRPSTMEGVWMSADGVRALMLVQTRASGADTDAQQQAMQRIQAAFDQARAQAGEKAAGVQLVMTGPGVFSVASRQLIQSEVMRISTLSILLIMSLLLVVYRSWVALALGLLPVLSGALVGVVAVSAGFGLVHGITLGFGTTLIGEAVDYSIYLFVQSRQPGVHSQSEWVQRHWPTIRLGVLTSIAGFGVLLFSSFPGLAQLGLYSVTGLAAAALVTRFVLPSLLPDDFRIADVSALGQRLQTLVTHAPLLRWPMALLTLAAVIWLVQHKDSLWSTELAALSPVPQAEQAIDARLRADMGAPDVRTMVVVATDSREATLQAVEKIAVQLQQLVEHDTLAAFESPSRYLPSQATQRQRQASLPSVHAAQRLETALAGLPLKAEVLQPFLEDMRAAKAGPLLDRKTLEGSSFALAVDSLLFEREGRWHAILPLVAASGRDAVDPAPVEAALHKAGVPDALFVDLKVESDRLYQGYLQQAIVLSLVGVLVILLLLAWALRSLEKTARVVLPLAMTVTVVVALLVLAGEKLIILHLIGLLLIMAVGSNYALFFSAARTGEQAATISPQTLTSLVCANLTTVSAFGLLAFSQIPILRAIGSTVGPGAMLALVFSAVFASRARAK